MSCRFDVLYINLTGNVIVVDVYGSFSKGMGVLYIFGHDLKQRCFELPWGTRNLIKSVRNKKQEIF